LFDKHCIFLVGKDKALTADVFPFLTDFEVAEIPIKNMPISAPQPNPYWIEIPPHIHILMQLLVCGCKCPAILLTVPKNNLCVNALGM
jgi:hypothetical protein